LVGRLRRSRSALQTDKERLAGLIREHLAMTSWQRVQEVPRWMKTLATHREKLACPLRTGGGLTDPVTIPMPFDPGRMGLLFQQHDTSQTPMTPSRRFEIHCQLSP